MVVLGVVLLALVLAVVAVSCLPAVVQQGVRRLSSQAGLPLREDLEPGLRRRLRTDAVVTGAGGAFGLGLALGTLQLWPDGPPEQAAFVPGFVVAIGAAVGIAATTSVEAAVRARKARPDGAPRVARLRATTVADHMGTVETVPPLLIAVAALAAGVVAVVVRGPSVSLVMLGIGPLALVGLAALLAQAVVAAPQPATDPLRLAWDDVFRVRDLRGVVALPSFSGFAATAVLLGLLLQEVPDAAFRDGLARAAVVGLVIAGGVLLAATAGHRPYRRVRRRLWPELGLQAETVSGRGSAHR